MHTPTLQYPNFDPKEFACLKQDLSCVTWWLELDRLNKQMEALQATKRDLETSAPLAAEQIKTSVLAGFNGMSPEARLGMLQSAYNDLTTTPTHLLGLGGRRGDIREILLKAYAVVDVAALEADWAKVSSGAEQQKKLKSVEGRMGPVQNNINKHRGTLAKCFVGDSLPSAWSRVSLPQDVADGPALLGTMVVAAFITAWRSRSQYFNVPVTITGIDIRSLASKERGIWVSAYIALGLPDVPKRPHYFAIPSGDRKLEEHMQSLALEGV